MASYATPANMLSRFDKRLIGGLVSDTGTEVAEGDLPTNAVLLELLADASGEVESALTVGERYSADQLAALTGNSQKLLIRLVCEITWLNLVGRRGEKYTEDYEAMRKAAGDRLNRLRKGENVFNIQATLEAGNIHVTGPSTVAIEQLQLMRDRVGTAYYPRRRMPFGR